MNIEVKTISDSYCKDCAYFEVVPYNTYDYEHGSIKKFKCKNFAICTYACQRMLGHLQEQLDQYTAENVSQYIDNILKNKGEN